MNRWLNEPEFKLRLEEEMARATRQGTSLGCLAVKIEDTKPLSEMGDDLVLDYLAGALAGQLRRYDRIGLAQSGELLVALPGADERRGELVARRVLTRLHAIKLETDGTRSSLPISVGIASLVDSLTGDDLIAQACLAARPS